MTTSPRCSNDDDDTLAVEYFCVISHFFSLELFALFANKHTSLVIVLLILTHVVFGVVLHASMRYDH